MFDAADFQRRFACALASAEPSGLFSPAFAVYRNTWVKALLDALHANYPTVAAILGPGPFEAVALEFTGRYPATTPVLALYGAEFAAFLRRHAAARNIFYLPEIAALERLWTECFFAPDAVAADLPALAALGAETVMALRPGLHPAARIARFETPAVTIWQAHQMDDFSELEPEWRPEHALVVRRGLSIQVERIAPEQFDLLAGLRHGEPLGAALEGVADRHPDADLGALLAASVESGALAGFRAAKKG